MKGIIGKLIGFVLLAGFVFGLFVIVFAPIEMSKKAKAETWPSRKGVITLSYARRNRGNAMSNVGGAYWKAEICGNYKDNGERFCISRVRFGGFRFGEGKAKAFETVGRYRVGREVDIFYSPENPKETVLEAHSSWNEMFILLGLAIAFLFLPVVLWVFRKKIESERYGRL
jgi:hypothetical protein